MAQPRTLSGVVCSVSPLDAQLQSSRTTALLKSSQLELVRIVLKAGQGLPEHRAPGEITVQCLEGCLQFSTGATTQCMRAGDLIHLAANVPHALLALEDMSALLTMCLEAPRLAA